MGHGKEKGEQVGGVQKGQREEKGRTRANPELDTQECWERGLLQWVEWAHDINQRLGVQGDVRRGCWVLTLVPSTCPCCSLVPPGASWHLKGGGHQHLSGIPSSPSRGPRRDFPGWDVGLSGHHSTTSGPLIIQDTHLTWPTLQPFLCSSTRRETLNWILFPRALEEFSQELESSPTSVLRF